MGLCKVSRTLVQCHDLDHDKAQDQIWCMYVWGPHSLNLIVPLITTFHFISTALKCDRQTNNSLWWPCHLVHHHWLWQWCGTQSDIQLTLMTISFGSLTLTVVWHTDGHTTHFDSHVIWIIGVDICMTDTETYILLTLMAMSFGSLVLTVVWQTDRHTTHSDGHVIWITCVDSCMRHTQTDILLTLMAMSFGSLVLTVVWQTDRQTYNSLWWPCHLDHSF